VSETETVRVSGSDATVELVLEASPRLYGTITGRNGEPIRRGGIFVMNATGLPTGPPASVRGEGYQLDLPGAGTWQLAFNDDDSPDVITREVTLQKGETRELNIDFGNRVTLHGRVVVNGATGRDIVTVLLRSMEGEDALAIPRGTDGRYEVEVTPGVYQLLYSSGQVTAPFGREIVVSDGPARQELDLSVGMAALDVLAVAPVDGPISGRLNIEAAAGGRPMTILRDFPVDRPSMRFLLLPAGSYRGELFQGGEAVAASDWVDIQPGQPGLMTIVIP
jgi:hypothetical protein